MFHISQKTKGIFLLIFIFITSRILYSLAGIRFDADVLNNWQFIDPELLTGDLLQSIYWLHAQPPLFNMFVGFVLKVFPMVYHQVFHGLFLILGLVLSITIFILMIKLDVPLSLSLAIAIIQMISPTAVLYENHLSYTYPVVTMLCLSALFLYRFLDEKRMIYGAIFFIFMAVIVLTRSLFHLMWFLFFIVLLVIVYYSDAKRVLLLASFPFLITTVWFVKNAYQFESFTSSSWLGMNLSKIVTFRLSADERASFIQEGNLSPLASIAPFQKPSTYVMYFPQTPKTNIAVLDQIEKSTGGPNYNHIVYIEVSKTYLQDALYILKARPDLYLKGIFRSLFIYFHSSSDYVAVEKNQARLGNYERLWNIIFYGQLRNYRDYQDRLLYHHTAHVGWLLVIAFTVGISYGIWVIVKSREKRRPLALTATVSYMLLNILYVTVIGNALEMGENNRFRFLVDPFVFILCGMFLAQIMKKLKLRMNIRKNAFLV